jgi:hypothetical protein
MMIISKTRLRGYRLVPYHNVEVRDNKDKGPTWEECEREEVKELEKNMKKRKKKEMKQVL